MLKLFTRAIIFDFVYYSEKAHNTAVFGDFRNRKELLSKAFSLATYVTLHLTQCLLCSS